MSEFMAGLLVGGFVVGGLITAAWIYREIRG